MARGFNGTTDRIDYGNIKATTGPQTFSAWIFSDNSVTGDERLFCEHISGNGAYSLLNQLGVNNHLEIVINTTNLTLKSYTNNAQFPSGVWFHYFWTWDGSLTAANVHQYVNNVEVSYVTQDNGSGTVEAPAGSWSFGYIPADSNFDGGLAEAGWWDRVLSADERKSLSKGFAPGCIPRGLKFAPDLIRNQREPISGQAGTLDGTTVRDHPRIINPFPSQSILFGINDITVEPAVLSLELDLLTPVLTHTLLISDAFELELNLLAPTIGITLPVSILVLELDLLTSTIYYDVAVNPAVLSLELDLLIPTIVYPLSIFPDVFALELDLLIPTIDYIMFVSPGVFALELSLVVPRVGVPFPTFSTSPKREGFVDEYSNDIVIVDTYASGYPLINPQFTFNPKFFSYDMYYVSQTDKESYMTFYENNKNNNILWTNEQDDNIYIVIFTEKPNCELQGAKEEWKIETDLKQVGV